MSNYLKSITKIFCLMLSCTVFFSACSITTKKLKNTNNSVEIIKLRFAALDIPDMKTEIEEFAAGFKKIMPNVELIYEPIVGDYTQKLILQATSKTLPDVFWVADVFVAGLSEKDVMLNLNPYMDKENIKKEDFYESMFKLGEYNGKQYMIPRDYSKVVTYYNKTLFNKNNIDFPTDDWTWEDFVKVAKKFPKKEGAEFTQFGCEASINWVATIIPIIEGLGGSILSTTGDSGNINTKETLAILKDIKKLVDEGVLTNTFSPGHPDFLSGKVAMYFSVRPNTKNVNDTLGSGNWDVVSFPKMPNRALTGIGASGYSVSAQTKYPDVASKLIFHIVGEEGQKAFMKTGNAVPILKSLKDDPTWRGVYPNINNDAFIKHSERDFIPIGSTLKNPLLRSKVDEIWIKAIENIILNVSTPEKALDEAQKRLNDVLSK